MNAEGLSGSVLYSTWSGACGTFAGSSKTARLICSYSLDDQCFQMRTGPLVAWTVGIAAHTLSVSHSVVARIVPGRVLLLEQLPAAFVGSSVQFPDEGSIFHQGFVT